MYRFLFITRIPRCNKLVKNYVDEIGKNSTSKEVEKYKQLFRIRNRI